MLGWSEFAVKQEQYQDLLREAERQRLIKHVRAGRERSATWQAIRDLALAITKRQPVEGEVPCGEHSRLAGKAA